MIMGVASVVFAQPVADLPRAEHALRPRHGGVRRRRTLRHDARTAATGSASVVASHGARVARERHDRPNGAEETAGQCS